MKKIRPKSTAHHIRHSAFQFKDLQTCTHVFVRVDAVRKPLQPPYEGPFKVISRISDLLYNVDVDGKETNISTERLKPAYIQRQPQDLDDEHPEVDSSDIHMTPVKP
ncbi:hypothetical protein KPH14_000593, partial [Odynerus spinipes]